MWMVDGWMEHVGNEEVDEEKSNAYHEYLLS